MVNIEGKSVTLNKSASEVYSYLMNMNNLENLLPMDKLSNYEASEDSCSFKVSGAADIKLGKGDCEEPTKVIYKTQSGSTFPFTLNVNIKDLGDGNVEVSQLAEADLNPFMKMMVQKPLTKLFDYIADRLPKALA